MHVFFLFFYFSICLTIEIVFDLFDSNIQKIEITRSYMVGPAILASFYWVYYTFSGKLLKTINKNYED